MARYACLLIVFLAACGGGSGQQPAPRSSEHTLDLQKIVAARTWIENETDYLDVFLLQHSGNIVTENYYRGFDRDTPHDMQSATKTFTGLLTGIALDQGLVSSLDQAIIELLPAYAGLLTDGKEHITVRHLLTMTSGLKWVDFGEERSFERMASASDSVAFILGEPLESEPGEVWFYNTGSSHLLSAIIHHNAGMSTAAFAEQYLFGPLEFGEYVWNAHRDGVNEGGWQLYLRPLDSLKFGQMLLERGTWNGQRIVSAEFVDIATSFINTTIYGTSGYGYQMWIETGFGADDVAGARGWGGQDILVLEDLHMVVVFNGSILRPADMAAAVARIMSEFVIPAHE